MDTWEEAVEYDAMDFTEVNTALPNSDRVGSPVLCKGFGCWYWPAQFGFT